MEGKGDRLREFQTGCPAPFCPAVHLSRTPTRLEFAQGSAGAAGGGKYGSVGVWGCRGVGATHTVGPSLLPPFTTVQPNPGLALPSPCPIRRHPAADPGFGWTSPSSSPCLCGDSSLRRLPGGPVFVTVRPTAYRQPLRNGLSHPADAIHATPESPESSAFEPCFNPSSLSLSTNQGTSMICLFFVALLCRSAAAEARRPPCVVRTQT